jgi:O-antigen/teichoic acid export membrane protein
MTTTARKLASGSTLRMTSLIAHLLISMFMMPFVVYSLGDRMYGFWTLLGTFIGYYGMLDFGLSTAVSRHIAGALGKQDNEECNNIFNIALRIYTIIGAIAFAITVILALLAPVFFTDPKDISLFRKVMLILGVNTAISFPIRVCVGVLTAQLSYNIITFIQFLSTIVRTLLIIVVLLSGYKVLALAVVTFISGIPEKILYIYYCKKQIPYLSLQLRGLNYRKAKPLFSYSSYSFIADIGDQLRFHVDAVVISAFVGLGAVTHYKIASFIAVQYMGLLNSFIGVIMPVFSRLEGEKKYDQIKNVFFLTNKIAVSMASFIGFCLIGFGKPFIKRWMGPLYLDSYPCLVVLILGLAFSFWQSPSISLLYGTSNHKFYAIYNTIEGIANLILSVVLVRYYGIFGVALGTFIPMIITRGIIQPIYVCRIFSFDSSDFFLQIGKSVGIGIISLVLPALIVIMFAVPNYMILMLLGSLSLCLYAMGLWKYMFNTAELEELRRIISPESRVKRA